MVASKKAAPRAQRQVKFTPPPDDARYKAVDRAMKRFDYEKDALLEVLNIAQEAFGFLPEQLLHYVAQQLEVPLAQVFGVATFYHMFSFEPLGEHNCVVCLGTACYVKGADKIVAALEAEHGIKQACDSKSLADATHGAVLDHTRNG